MTSMLYDEIDMDAEEWGNDDEYEAYGDPDEASNDDRRRRRVQAQQRRVELAQRRRAQSRARGVPARRAPTPAVAQRATQSAIRTLDLENKVAQDSFRGASAAADKRMSRAEYSAVASAAVNQFIETFNTPQNDIGRAALRFAPLLLLAPQHKRKGIEGWITDPRAIGLAAVGTIVLVGELRKKGDTGNQLEISGPAQLTALQEAVYNADVRDGNNNVVDNVAVTWTVEPGTVASLNPASGPSTTVKALVPGNATITARSDKLLARFQLTVVAPPHHKKEAEDDAEPKPPASSTTASRK